MPKTFTAQVDRWIAKSRKRTRAVVQTATQDLLTAASLQGPSVKNPAGGKGGRMPVDTGFLRASLSVSFSGMPLGPGKGAPDVKYGDPAFQMKLLDFTPGKTIYAGWTAKYARFMENRYGFMRGAAQNWKSYVQNAAAEVKRRMP